MYITVQFRTKRSKATTISHLSWPKTFYNKWRPLGAQKNEFNEWRFLQMFSHRFYSNQNSCILLADWSFVQGLFNSRMSFDAEFNLSIYIFRRNMKIIDIFLAIPNRWMYSHILLDLSSFLTFVFAGRILVTSLWLGSNMPKWQSMCVFYSCIGTSHNFIVSLSAECSFRQRLGLFFFTWIMSAIK